MSTTAGTTACEHCGHDETGWNPKGDQGLYYKRGSSSVGRVSDPLEEETKDVDLARMAYRVLPIIPFLDNSDATLQFLRKMTGLSPTDGSCINSIGTYVIEGGIVVTDKVRPGAAVDRANRKSPEITDAAFDILESWHPESTVQFLLEQAECGYKNWKTYGNLCLRLKWYEIAGKKFFDYKVEDCENWRYWATYPNEARMVVISQLWTWDYITRNPPEWVGVWPEVTVNDADEFETVIIINNKVPGRPWYGLPDSIQSLYPKYMEYLMGTFSTKGYRRGWTGKVFMETVGDNVAVNEIQELRKDLRMTFTNEGEGNTIVHRHRSKADEPTQVDKFEADTNHEFHEIMGDRSEADIIKAHNWHRVLMGVPTPGRLGGEGEFAKVYRVKEKTVIRPLQNKVMRPFNTMLRIAEEWFGETYDFMFGLAPLFSEDELKSMAGEQQPAQTEEVETDD